MLELRSARGCESEREIEPEGEVGREEVGWEGRGISTSLPKVSIQIIINGTRSGTRRSAVDPRWHRVRQTPPRREPPSSWCSRSSRCRRASWSKASTAGGHSEKRDSNLKKETEAEKLEKTKQSDSIGNRTTKQPIDKATNSSDWTLKLGLAPMRN